MITQNEDAKQNKKENLTEEDGLISVSQRPSIMNPDLENKAGKYSTPPANKKMSHSSNLNNLILSCVKNEEYCLSMLDYMKKMCHFSQIDYYSAYTQLLYCFKPKEM